jgi:tetracycline 7-halogenase / FADH2 O2-dependent halogenase
MTETYDLAILGSGFAGSLMAMVARRLGLTVLLLERGTHPRFVIGESTSPLTNLLLEELAHKYDLPRLLPFTSYGAWQRAYPEVAVGLKRGFTFYHHTAGHEFADTPAHANQLLVAASPNDEVADTHWYRPEFDHFLVREAESLGVTYRDRATVPALSCEAGVTTLRYQREGAEHTAQAQFVLDASGMRGALSRLLALPEGSFSSMPRTEALYTHFTDVGRFAEQLPSDGEASPYAPDDAALHHVFDGGWMWVLRFNNGLTSAGFAAEEWLARELRLEEGEPAWERFLTRYPSIGRHFAHAVPARPFVHARQLSWRSDVLSGDGWAMLPSAAAFIDPLFSTGFTLTLLGIHRMARALRESWETPAFRERIEEYAAQTAREAESTARLVGACYATFRSLPAFARLSMLYFIAASYSEMARRLERPHLATAFLLQNQPCFAETFTRHTGATLACSFDGLASLAAEVEPFNIAGLCDAAKRNWYGVDLSDVVRGAAKLHATPEEVSAFFARMGWA